jgi:hypothetical protein
LNPETYINVEVNLFHIWEDSNLGYNADGFSIHELYRDLSSRQGFKIDKLETWEILMTVS